jgi:hypothetical protein
VLAAAALSLLAASAAPSSATAYDFAVSLAHAGPRPAGSAAERRAHQQVATRFRAAGLRVGYERFAVPGHGHSRDVMLSLDEVGRGTRFDLHSTAASPRAAVEDRILAAGRAAKVRVDWVQDAGTGNSDHREFALAGAPGAKLGIPDEPCRHTLCDTADRLERGAFTRVLRVVWPLLRTWK